MEKQVIDDKIKELFISSRVIALVGASNDKEKESNKVMRFLQRAGYKVIPVNPTCINNFIHGEKVYGSLIDIEQKVDIVDVFRPSSETEGIAKEAIKKGTSVLWLQYGIHSDEAQTIADKENIQFISNRCIKQEYQKLFQKSNPVFPVLKD